MCIGAGGLGPGAVLGVSIENFCGQVLCLDAGPVCCAVELANSFGVAGGFWLKCSHTSKRLPQHGSGLWFASCAFWRFRFVSRNGNTYRVSIRNEWQRTGRRYLRRKSDCGNLLVTWPMKAHWLTPLDRRADGPSSAYKRPDATIRTHPPHRVSE